MKNNKFTFKVYVIFYGILLLLLSCDNPGESVTSFETPNIKWTNRNAPQTGTAYQISKDGNCYYLLGYDGVDYTIFKSENNEYSWKEFLTVGNGLYFESFLAINNKIIINTRYQSKFSADSGRTWNNFPSDILKIIKKGNLLFALGHQVIYYSSDFGQTWRSNNIYTNKNIDYNKNYYVKGSTIYVYDSEKIIYSSDMGVNWQPITIPSSAYVSGEVINYPFIRVFQDKLVIANNFNSAIYDFSSKNWSKFDLNYSNTSGIINDDFYYCNTNGDLLKYSNNTSSIFLKKIPPATFTSIYFDQETDMTFVGYSNLGVFVKKGLSGFKQIGYSPLYINSLEIYSNRMFAGTSNGLFESEDDGITWKYNDYIGKSCYTKKLNDISFALIISETNKPIEIRKYNLLNGGSDSLWTLKTNIYLTNNKRNLSKSSGENAEETIQIININSNIIYAVLGGSAYKFFDNLTKWEFIFGGFQTACVTKSEDVYYSKSQDRTLYRYITSEKKSVEVTNQLSSREVKVRGVNSHDQIFVSNVIGEYPYTYDLKMSNESKDKFTSIKSNISYSNTIYIDNDDNIFFGDHFGIYYSGNQGKNWKTILTFSEESYGFVSIKYIPEVNKYYVLNKKGTSILVGAQF